MDKNLVKKSIIPVLVILAVVAAFGLGGNFLSPADTNEVSKVFVFGDKIDDWTFMVPLQLSEQCERLRFISGDNSIYLIDVCTKRLKEAEVKEIANLTYSIMHKGKMYNYFLATSTTEDIPFDGLELDLMKVVKFIEP